MKIGNATLEENGNYKNLYEYNDGDTWGFFSNTIYKKHTRLAANLLISFGMFYRPIRDKNPKIRVHASDNYDEDFYISLEKRPKIIIGENTTLSENELQDIFNYITEHLEVLLEHWNSNGEMDGMDLEVKLGIKS